MTDELPEEATPEPTESGSTNPAVPNPNLPPEPAPRGPAGPRPPLPGTVTAAAIILLVFGTIAAFGSALFLLGSLSMRRFMPMFDPDFGSGYMPGFDGGQFWFVGIATFGVAVLIGAAIAGGHIAAGWAILQRLGWGRILGMVVSGVALVVGVLGVAGTLIWASAIQSLPDYVGPGWMGGGGHMMDWYRGVMTSGVAFGVVASIAVAAAYVFVLVVLARHGEIFD